MSTRENSVPQDAVQSGAASQKQDPPLGQQNLQNSSVKDQAEVIQKTCTCRLNSGEHMTYSYFWCFFPLRLRYGLCSESNTCYRLRTTPRESCIRWYPNSNPIVLVTTQVSRHCPNKSNKGEGSGGSHASSNSAIDQSGTRSFLSTCERQGWMSTLANGKSSHLGLRITKVSSNQWTGCNIVNAVVKCI